LPGSLLLEYGCNLTYNGDRMKSAITITNPNNNPHSSAIVDVLLKSRYNPKRFGKYVKNTFLLREHQFELASNLMERVENPDRIQDLLTSPNNFKRRDYDLPNYMP
jgi:hypothetical protein